MTSQNLRENDYPSRNTGPTVGQAVKHPVESARAEVDRLSHGNKHGHTGTGTGTGEAFSTGRGGVGNIGSSTSDYTGASDVPYGANTTGAHHTGHHTGGLAETGIGSTGAQDTYSTERRGVGTTGATTGLSDSSYDTSTTGTHSHETVGASHHTGGTHIPGTGLGATAGTSTGGTSTHSGHHTGAHTGASGTHSGTTGTTGTDTKVSIGDKIRGTVEKVAGKVTSDPELVAEGQQRKEGTHPSQTNAGTTAGTSRTTGTTGHHTSGTHGGI